MVSRRRTIAFFLALLGVGTTAASAGCADTDPRYGTPESIRGRKIDFGLDGGVDDTPPPPAGATPRSLFTAIYTKINGGGGATACTPCHAAGGQGGVAFVAATEDAAYAFFKAPAQNYQNLTAAPLHSFYNKGQHVGPPLDAAEKAATKAWADAENAAGGGAPVTDAGGGPVDAGVGD